VKTPGSPGSHLSSSHRVVFEHVDPLAGKDFPELVETWGTRSLLSMVRGVVVVVVVVVVVDVVKLLHYSR